MLKQRIITALVIAMLFSGILLFFSVEVTSFIFMAVIVLCAWEWCTLSGLKSSVVYRLLYMGLVLFLCVILIPYLHIFNGLNLGRTIAVFQLSISVWVINIIFLFFYPHSRVIWGSIGFRLFWGVLVLVPLWLSLSLLLQTHVAIPLFVLFVLLVIFTDVGGYFVGRAFGRHALMPQVSPNKTWEGFFGGVLLSIPLMLIFLLYYPIAITTWKLLVLVLATGVMAVVGDLTVSMIKRHENLKDTGHLLPGHGGLLDRFDGFSAAAPFFLLSLLLLGME